MPSATFGKPPVRLLSISEAAELVGVSKRTIERAIADGRLAHYRLGPALVRISSTQLEAFQPRRRRHAS